MTVLLDGNILIAITLSGHVHHDAAARWMGARAEPFATSPITQGALIRTMIRLGASGEEAIELMMHLSESPDHVFWPDDIPYSRGVMGLVSGHAGVTDAYLASLARTHAGRVATIDRRFAGLYPDVVEVIEPT